MKKPKGDKPASSAYPKAFWSRQTAQYEYRLYYQPYSSCEKKSIAVDKNIINEILESKSKENDLLIYLPIYLFDDIYCDPEQFGEFLQEVVSIFAPKPIHIAMILSDELNRHVIFKKIYMSSPYENDPELIEKEARDEAKTGGDVWLLLNSIDALSKELGCKVTLFRWGELINSPDLRAHIIKKMHLETKLQSIEKVIEFSQLIKFVAEQHRTGVGFATDIFYQLIQASQNDLATWESNTNVKVSDTCNKNYIFEKTAQSMHVYATGLFDVVIQPHVFVKRKFPGQPSVKDFCEILHYWAIKLLKSYIDNIDYDNAHFSATSLPVYMTLGRYPAPGVKPIGHKKTYVITPAESASHTLFEKVFEEVNRRGLQDLDMSELILFQRALEWANHERSEEIPQDADEAEILESDSSFTYSPIL